MHLDFNVSLKIGTFRQKASPTLSIFVIACCIMVVALLFMMQRAQAAADNLSAGSDYSSYL